MTSCANDQFDDKLWSYWADVSASLTKWIFATLVTINIGAMAFSFTLGLHPDALRAACGSFFVGLCVSLLAGIFHLFISNFVIMPLSVNPSVDENSRKSENFAPRGLVSAVNFWLSIGIICIPLSLYFFLEGGNHILKSVSPCTSSDFQYGKNIGGNIVFLSPGNVKTCYFYQINGLSNDPLKRAKQEEYLLRKYNSEKNSSEISKI